MKGLQKKKKSPKPKLLKKYSSKLNDPTDMDGEKKSAAVIHLEMVELSGIKTAAAAGLTMVVAKAATDTSTGADGVFLRYSMTKSTNIWYGARLVCNMQLFLFALELDSMLLGRRVLQ